MQHGARTTPAEQTDDADPAARAAAANYVASMSGELALIARRQGLDTLGYILDMARLEAETALGMLTSTRN